MRSRQPSKFSLAPSRRLMPANTRTLAFLSVDTEADVADASDVGVDGGVGVVVVVVDGDGSSCWSSASARTATARRRRQRERAVVFAIGVAVRDVNEL